MDITNRDELVADLRGDTVKACFQCSGDKRAVNGEPCGRCLGTGLEPGDGSPSGAVGGPMPVATSVARPARLVADEAVVAGSFGMIGPATEAEVEATMLPPMMAPTRVRVPREAVKIREVAEIIQPAPTAYEQVDHPPHYGGASNVYEAIEIIEALDLGFHAGNCLKYLVRAGRKPGTAALTDYRKSRWYLDRLIARLEETR